MKNNIFKRMTENLIEISKMPEKCKEKHLDLFMSQGYLFLDLTDKQVEKIKAIFRAHYPSEYKVYSEPDEHGFTSEFRYLRFK